MQCCGLVWTTVLLHFKTCKKKKKKPLHVTSFASMLINSLTDALQNNDTVLWEEVADNKGVERAVMEEMCPKCGLIWQEMILRGQCATSAAPATYIYKAPQQHPLLEGSNNYSGAYLPRSVTPNKICVVEKLNRPPLFHKENPQEAN